VVGGGLEEPGEEELVVDGAELVVDGADEVCV
jgi:hypothetical protein